MSSQYYEVRIKRLRSALHFSIKNRCKHLLTLVDTSPYSAAYGCFDRTYWQYKVKDFPSGMSQECLYPLSLALKNNLFPNLKNKSFENLKDIILNSIRYSLKSQNPNGSVDDYFPFEQASGATAFSCFAILNVIGLNIVELSEQELNLLIKRLNWLSKSHESGRLSNHEALIALVLAMAAKLLNNSYFHEKSINRIKNLLTWRNEEGWFEEYSGFDIGYETLTFSCLNNLKIYIPELKSELEKVTAKQFNLIMDFVEPDGNIGGELYARGTWNCFTHGLLSYSINKKRNFNKIISILEARYLDQIEVKDDYIIQHHLWSDILTYELLNDLKADKSQNYQEKNNITQDIQIEKFYPESGHLWIKHGEYTTHISLKKGGAFRLYKNDIFIFQDTQNALKTNKDKFVANILNNNISYKWLTKNKLKIKGLMTKKKDNLMNTNKLIFLRLLMNYLGKYFPNIIRKLMQKLLINIKANKNRYFIRNFEFKENKLVVSDSYKIKTSEKNKADLIETSFDSSTHNVMGKVFHPYHFQLIKSNKNEKYFKNSYLTLKREW